MGMVVNQNLSAMSAHRYLKNNDSNFSKSVERLSSGLRINRAADDPAGLVISEKYRSQIDGLNQAVKNAQDGISLVQTAEGALDEVNTVLRTMRNLALHAASTGTTDTAAAQADQEQIESSIATLNRIANTTAFGTRKLLNGSSGVTGTPSDTANVSFIEGTTATQDGTYAVNVTAASEQGVHGSNSAKAAYVDQIGVDLTGITIAAGDTLTFGGDLFNGESVTVTSTGTTIGQFQTDMESAFDAAGFTDFTYSNDGNAITIDNVDRISGNVQGTDYTLAEGMTDANFVVGDVAANDAGNVSSGSVKLSLNETLTFRNDSSTVRVALLAGTTIDAAVSQINSELDDAGFEVTASYDTTAFAFQLTNDDYGATDVVTYSVASSLADSDNSSGLGAVAGTDYTIATGAGTGGNAGVNVAGTINGNAATSSGGVYLTGASGQDEEGLKISIAGGVSGALGNVAVTNNSLTFQVGAFENQTVKIAISDMRTNQLGSTATGTYTSQGLDNGVNIANLDVTTAEGAQDAIKVIDAAISEVTSNRSEMGSFQKDILETTVRSLGVASQNMSASESVIRDADMAEEMLSFSRAQILSQTGMSMLAQANQAPQGIMRLFG